MDEKTLIILSKLQRGDISYKKVCKLLKKREKEIDKLFDSNEYFYLPIIKDEKRLFEIEKENIKNLMKIADTRESFSIELSKDVFPKEFIAQSYPPYSGRYSYLITSKIHNKKSLVPIKITSE